MIPIGYMAKKISKNQDWLISNNIIDIYSVSRCVSEDFTDYIKYWKHNGYWFFDSPDIIMELAKENSIDLSETTLFFYEAYELEFNEQKNIWEPFSQDPSLETNIMIPREKYLQGYDIVSFSLNTSPECSPLSCCALAKEIKTNKHCLLDSYEEAKTCLEKGSFNNSEPGSYRIFAVYSLVENITS
jgi:hypothetical protein